MLLSVAAFCPLWILLLQSLDSTLLPDGVTTLAKGTHRALHITKVPLDPKSRTTLSPQIWCLSQAV